MRSAAKKKKSSAGKDWDTLPLHDELGEALRAELLRWPGLEPRPMMGTLSFFHGKHMLGCYVHRALFKKTPPRWAPRADEPPFVWVRLSPDGVAKALRRPHVRGARTKMKTWVEIGLASRGALEEAVHWFGKSYEEGKSRRHATR